MASLGVVAIAASVLLGSSGDAAAPCDALVTTCPLEAGPLRFRVGPTRFEFLARSWRDEANSSCTRNQIWLASPTLGLLRFREDQDCCTYGCDTVPRDALVSARAKDARSLVVGMKRTGYEPETGEGGEEGRAVEVDEKWSETVRLADFSSAANPRVAVELPRLRRPASPDAPDDGEGLCPAVEVVGFSPDGRFAYVEHGSVGPDGTQRAPQLVVQDLVRDRELARRPWVEGKTTVGHGVRAGDPTSSPPAWWGALHASERRGAWSDLHEVRVNLLTGEEGERRLEPEEGEYCVQEDCYRLIAAGADLVLQRDGPEPGRKLLSSRPSLTRPPVRMIWIESPWEPRVALLVNVLDPAGRCALEVVGAHLRSGFSPAGRPAGGAPSAAPPTP